MFLTDCRFLYIPTIQFRFLLLQNLAFLIFHILLCSLDRTGERAHVICHVHLGSWVLPSVGMARALGIKSVSPTTTFPLHYSPEPRVGLFCRVILSHSSKESGIGRRTPASICAEAQDGKMREEYQVPPPHPPSVVS